MKERTRTLGPLSLVLVLAWLVYGPYFHAHEAAEGGEVHAHFDVDGHEAHHDDHAELELPHHTHHGTDVSVFTAHFSPAVQLVAELREVYLPIEAPVLHGTVIEHPVRVHDPPRRASSNPRSPPA